MANRKDRRASAREAAKWERDAAARMASVDSHERLKERMLEAARQDDGGGSALRPGLPAKAAAPQTDWMPLQAIAAMAATAFPAYLVAEAAIGGPSHPLHWLAALIAGAAGYLGGLVFYRKRGY